MGTCRCDRWSGEHIAGMPALRMPIDRGLTAGTSAPALRRRRPASHTLLSVILLSSSSPTFIFSGHAVTFTEAEVDR